MPNRKNEGKGKTAITSNALVPQNRGQPLKSLERKEHSIERKGGLLSGRGDGTQSRSNSRTISQKRRPNVNNEVPEGACRHFTFGASCRSPMDSSNIKYTNFEDD